MKLVITEKPSVARAIAKVLGANDRKQGYILGNGYIVSWCIGHLVSLSKPEDYNDKYAKWNMDDLPIIPDQWQFSVKEGTKQQYKVLDQLMKSKEVTSIIEATDAGREGELIFRLVYDQSGCDKPFQRLWISSMEDDAIKAGFEDLRTGTAYEALYQSALARSKADWLVGLNATRLFTTSYHIKLSVGRVQTPTLAMIVERDEKIRTFAKEKFYHIELNLGDFKVKSHRIGSFEEAKKLSAFCEGKQVEIKSLLKELKRKRPPALFDLTTLQREANRTFGYTAKQTLDYTQSLYEKKLVTYPRTDSRYLSDDMAESVEKLLPVRDDSASWNISRIVNKDKVTDHHAIIHTALAMEMGDSDIPKNELNILRMIQAKLEAAVSFDYQYEQVGVTAMIDDVEFYANTKIVVEAGFRKVETSFRKTIGIKVEDEPKANTRLLKLKEGDSFDIKEIDNVEGETSPPKRFTEDTLLSAMERAGVEELDDSLETEKQGLGTPATRAAIIEKLIVIDYVERKKKSLFATQKGIELVKVVPEQLKSAKLTAMWEKQLTEISDGKRSSADFLEEIRQKVVNLVNNHSVTGNQASFKVETKVVGKCPRCGSDVYEGKKNFYCSDKGCKFSMWKEDKFFLSKRKTLTKTMAKSLLAKGKVKVRKLYSSNKDKHYDATVVLKDTGTWVNYKLEF